MYIIVLLFPLLSFFCSGVFGNFYGRYVGVYLSVFIIGISLFSAVYIFYEVRSCQAVVSLKSYNFILSDIMLISIGSLYDSLTCIMVFIILFVSFFAHSYSIDYMSNDPYLLRFISYLSLFTFNMSFLVTPDNFLQMFLG